MSGIRGLFEKYSAKLAEYAPGAERAKAVHQLIDREMKAANGLPVTCGKGCAGCCSYEVEVTSDDAALLADVVRSGVAIDRARLDAQAARERKSPEWRQFGRVDNRCVFLGADNACRIYERVRRFAANTSSRRRPSHARPMVRRWRRCRSCSRRSC